MRGSWRLGAWRIVSHVLKGCVICLLRCFVTGLFDHQAGGFCLCFEGLGLRGLRIGVWVARLKVLAGQSLGRSLKSQRRCNEGRWGDSQQESSYEGVLIQSSSRDSGPFEWCQAAMRRATALCSHLLHHCAYQRRWDVLRLFGFWGFLLTKAPLSLKPGAPYSRGLRALLVFEVSPVLLREL